MITGLQSKTLDHFLLHTDAPMAEQVLKTALPSLRHSVLVGVLAPDAASALPFPEQLAGRFAATGKLILYDGRSGLPLVRGLPGADAACSATTQPL
jgi:hypothetical protein